MQIDTDDQFERIKTSGEEGKKIYREADQANEEILLNRNVIADRTNSR
jgi:hypothetical protein